MMSRHYLIYPSWFGGADEADKAIVELAEREAAHISRDVGDIRVNRNNHKCWKFTVEFHRPVH